MRNVTVATRRGQVVTVTLRRPISEILAGWKAAAVRRKVAVRKPAKPKSAPVGG